MPIYTSASNIYYCCEVKVKVKVKSLSRVRPSATPWTAAFQAAPSMGFFQAAVLERGAIAFSDTIAMTACDRDNRNRAVSTLRIARLKFCQSDGLKWYLAVVFICLFLIIMKWSISSYVCCPFGYLFSKLYIFSFLLSCLSFSYWFVCRLKKYLFNWLCQVFAAVCRILFPDQGWNLGPLHWEHGVLATAPTGMSF